MGHKRQKKIAHRTVFVGEKIVVRTLLQYFATTHHVNSVGISNGTKNMNENDSNQQQRTLTITYEQW